jgi:uncharacterized membrane protein YdjX (TVP38/TMEM64 family)
LLTRRAGDIMRIPNKVIVIVSIVGVYLFFRYVGISEYLTFEQLKANCEVLQEIVALHYYKSVLLYIGIYILAIALSFPSASLLTLAGGLLFGTLLGTLYSVIGATSGASIAFVLVRSLFAKYVQKKYPHKTGQFNQAIAEHGVSFLLFVRLVGIFPFFLINSLAALTPVSFGMFVWTTALGIIPGSLVYTFAGTQLRSLNSVRDVLSPALLGVFLLLGILALLPIILKRLTKKS